MVRPQPWRASTASIQTWCSRGCTLPSKASSEAVSTARQGARSHGGAELERMTPAPRPPPGPEAGRIEIALPDGIGVPIIGAVPGERIEQVLPTHSSGWDPRIVVQRLLWRLVIRPKPTHPNSTTFLFFFAHL